VTEFRKAIRLDRDNGEYERGLGWAMFNGNNKTEGIGHLYRALELSPSNLHVMTDSGLSLSDRCAFVVSHSLLPGDTFLDEDAYTSDRVCDYPKGTFPCIGLMYL